ncbi:serine/threonine-protein kinase [Luteimonas lutimaris]
MDPEKIAHWQAADAAFDQWLDLPYSERDAWLAGHALPEPVRRRLVQLITAHCKPRPSLDPGGSDLAGCRLGDWTLDAELGRGGMAVVYRAWREQGMARQQAAVKILTLGALGATGRERFRREAAILARLNHPNVTALIDSGVADDGTFWLAMPLVDGERIDRWCEAHSPDAHAIVRLYLQVCGAVAYAHRNLVIHRDIKPSNVLVDDDGHVRLLDFGIGQFADAQGEQTQTMWRALTPGYAAPEQLAGAPPSTAVDVYGLGALLHRLLTGRTPQAATQSTDTTRPSLLVRDAGDAYHRHYVPLKNDLDRVLLKALAEEPEQRYATAEALADDLRRWLDGQPVLAQKPKLGYRVRKFATRNKIGVAAGVLLALSLAGGIGATLWQAQQARQEAERALAARNFMAQLFEASDPDVAQGRVISARELLDQGAHQIRTAFSDTPHLRAEMLLLIGDLYRKIGETKAAAPLLRQGLELAESRRDLDLRVQARTSLGQLHLDEERPADAVAEFETAANLLASSGRVPGARHGLLMRDMATALAYAGQAPSAIERAEAALALARKRNASDEALFAYLLALGSALDLSRTGQDQRTDGLLREALALKSTDSVPPTRRIQVHLMLSSLALTRGDHDEAHAQAKQALDLASRLYTPMSYDRASILINSALVLLHMGRLDAAESELRESLAIQESLAPGERTEMLAATYNNLALALELAERDEEAAPLIARARDAASELFGQQDMRYAIATTNLGNSYRRLGRFAEAELLLEQSLALRRSLLGGAHPEIGHCLVQLATLRLDQERTADALALADQAMALYADADYWDPRRIATARMLRARAMARLGRVQEAGELFDRTVAEARSAGVDNGTQWVRILAARADFEIEHRPGLAAPMIAEALDGYARTFGNDHPGTRRYAALAKQH